MITLNKNVVDGILKAFDLNKIPKSKTAFFSAAVVSVSSRTVNPEATG